MDVDEEMQNAKDEARSTRRLSAILENAHGLHTDDDAESFDWVGADESDSEPEVVQDRAKVCQIFPY